MIPKLIDYAQMERIYGLKKSTFTKLVMKGEFIPSVRVGKKHFFKTEDIDNWIDSHTTKDK